MNKIRRLFLQLKRAIKFGHLGFTTYDYDFGCTEKILRVALEEQLSLFTSNRTVVDWTGPAEKKQLKALKIVVKLLKYTDFELKNKPELGIDFDISATGRFTVIRTGDIETYDRLVSEESKIIIRRRKLLFRLLEKYMQSWWD